MAHGRTALECLVLLAVGLATCAESARGQVPLPSTSGPYLAQDVQQVSHLDPPILPSTEPYAVQQPLFTPREKKGALQQLFHSTTRLAPGAEDDLGQTEFLFTGTVGLPLPTRESPLLITPGFGVQALDGFETLDLPNELYDAYVEFRWLRPITQRFIADVGVTPGMYGNFDDEEDEFRLQGRAVGIYQWSERTKLVLGTLYLDRHDITFLPVAGMIWTPNDWTQFDLLFPKPKVAVRVRRDRCSEWWVYLAGELGGGSWGLERADGSSDAVTLRDYRVMLGLERNCHGPTLRIEGGLVFGRELEYQSGLGDTELESTGLIRGVIAY